jgi:hypothetical protein
MDYSSVISPESFLEKVLFSIKHLLSTIEGFAPSYPVSRRESLPLPTVGTPVDENGVAKTAHLATNAYLCELQRSTTVSRVLVMHFDPLHF